MPQKLAAKNERLRQVIPTCSSTRRAKTVLGQVALPTPDLGDGKRAPDPGRGPTRWPVRMATNHRRDLFDHIANFRFPPPSWTLKFQVMPFEDAKTYRINPFDLTKTGPHNELSADGGPARLTLDHQPPPRWTWDTQDRAAGVRAQQHGPRHRAEPRQDASGAWVFLCRRTPRPAGVNYKQIPVQSGQRAAGGAFLLACGTRPPARSNAVDSGS